MNNPATVIIPNYNGEAFLADLMDSLQEQTMQADIIVVDNASTDKSLAMLLAWEEEDRLTLIRMDKNAGFAAAVNKGVQAATTQYVILLNNDTRVDKDFVQEMVFAMRKKKKTFSISALMLKMDDPGIVDDSGDLFSAIGWAFSTGRDKARTRRIRRMRVTSACAGAAIYNRKMFMALGMMDEAHFAYLEDVDIGIRATRRGWYSYFEPDAVVYHKASATSGSRYNAFKTRLAVGNTMYTVWKNLPAWMIAVNAPLLCGGFLVKMVFYAKKGYLDAFMTGIKEGIGKIRNSSAPRPVTTRKNLKNDVLFEIELLANCVRRMVA